MNSEYYIGIMSGTSLDGIDVVLVDFNATSSLIYSYFSPYDDNLRKALLSLHQSGYDELDRAALLSNYLSSSYALAVQNLLKYAEVQPQEVAAIGCHGQTIRHCPETDKRYTIQLVNAALLAELTQITVVADFRSRDIAAGGQGAPLVPAFHQAWFGDSNIHRVIVNIGGIANITNLDPRSMTIGFDCGPGNILMDAWCQRHRAQHFDKDGQWAASGEVIPELLVKFLENPFFASLPPKSTGRELFNLEWVQGCLCGNEKNEDVQATLLQLTVETIVQSIQVHCSGASEIYVCGGGAQNAHLMRGLMESLPGKRVTPTDSLGIAADWVEAFAFAWLGQRTLAHKPGNLPAVTGANGERILGAIYPA
ncbi:MAG TPA: anhydro-N-acetylmuramic acid kinase [Nitrosomonas sp.]|nr:anhydro-N-acetylmuramic acid kinase [Nitrosomonas sp.]